MALLGPASVYGVAFDEEAISRLLDFAAGRVREGEWCALLAKEGEPGPAMRGGSVSRRGTATLEATRAANNVLGWLPLVAGRKQGVVSLYAPCYFRSNGLWYARRGGFDKVVAWDYAASRVGIAVSPGLRLRPAALAESYS